jgi:hypothetical protein
MSNFNVKLFVIFVLTFSQLACGQNDFQTGESKLNNVNSETEYPSLKKQAQDFCDAVVNNDYEKVYNLTYPKLIEQKLAVFKTKEKILDYVKKRC